MSFVEKLDEEGLAYFNAVCAKPFSDQAVSFLNAYWNEVGDQAEFIFSCAYEVMKYADMHAKGIQYIHQYDEGNDVDFNIGLYFYETLTNSLDDASKKLHGKDSLAHFKSDAFKKSQPETMTAIVRKRELREKVDVNFDGRVGFLEYLLYQYKDVANPADFVTRSMKAPDEHPEIKKARLALEEVNARIRAYESEKARLEEASKLPGVKGLKAKNLLAQLDSSPLKEELNMALIKAEAAVRMVTKKFGKGGSASAEGGESMPTEGAVWWMNRDLTEKKKKYGRK
jgi:hypothetical protein